MDEFNNSNSKHMKKIILSLLIFSFQCNFYAQSSEKIVFEIRSEVSKTTSENKKEKKNIRDPHYKIKLTKYGENLIEYDRAYENYYHFNHIYLVKNNFISYLSDKGQSAKVSSGEVNENISYGDLYEVEYFFIDENKGYKYEKRVPLYVGNNINEKQKELDKLEYTITEINNSDYISIYKFYERNVKEK
jgi:hypothetical protein